MIGLLERITTKRLWILVIGLVCLIVYILSENVVIITLAPMIAIICFSYIIAKVVFPVHFAKPEWEKDYEGKVLLKDVVEHYGEDWERAVKCIEIINSSTLTGHELEIEVCDCCGELSIPKKNIKAFIKVLRIYKVDKLA